MEPGRPEEQDRSLHLQHEVGWGQGGAAVLGTRTLSLPERVCILTPPSPSLNPAPLSSSWRPGQHGGPKAGWVFPLAPLAWPYEPHFCSWAFLPGLVMRKHRCVEQGKKKITRKHKADSKFPSWVISGNKSIFLLSPQPSVSMETSPVSI